MRFIFCHIHTVFFEDQNDQAIKMQMYFMYIPKLFLRQFGAEITFISSVLQFLDLLFSLQLIQASEPEFVCPPYV